MSFTEDFQHLKITLDDITSATDNFSSDKQIGRGGFGRVYLGHLPVSAGLSRLVAFKRLDNHNIYGQGNPEFWKEIMMLSLYKHENLVSLLHFCDEGDEKIIVYEYASRGSLDRYLSNPSLTWIARLDICLGAARALNYLHDPMGTQQRLIHRDIKSANILIDENWTAKVSDFGLSKLAPANQQLSYVATHAVGTAGYCDPTYYETGMLSKESDVYSFGVVLLEVMCGRLCYDHNGRILVNEWKTRCHQRRFDDIIFENLKEQMVTESLMKFSAIANRCLKREPKHRPTMAVIIKELEVALEQQKRYQDTIELVKIAKLARLSYGSQMELVPLFSQGVLLFGGDTWVSLNKNGKIYEMISARKCISGGWLVSDTIGHSRFKKDIKCVTQYSGFKVNVSAEFLIPNVTYTINLVFKHDGADSGTYVPFQYKLDEEKHYYNSYPGRLRHDGWLMTELYCFRSYRKQHKFEIDFLPRPQTTPIRLWCPVEGVEFCPLEIHETQENLEKVDTHPTISKSETDWELHNLPTNCLDLIKLSKHDLHWTTKKELYLLLRDGFLIIDDGYKWCFISENWLKCLVIPARAFLQIKDWIWKNVSESRFNLVAESPATCGFSVGFKIKSGLLSPHTIYSCHLIYKLPDQNESFLNNPFLISLTASPHVSWHPKFNYLICHTPYIGPKVHQNPHILSHTNKIEGHPELRKDGWMEFQLLQVSTASTEAIQAQIKISSYEDNTNSINFSGLVVQGIEFRPFVN